MPSAAEVSPEKWSDIVILFDDGGYSVIAGVYERDRRVLGERWNGDGDTLGFPNIAGYPVWHVVPEFLAVPILQGLLVELARHPQRREYTPAILRELDFRHGHADELAATA